MFNRFIRAALDTARHKASQSAVWAVVARDTVSGFVTTAHHALMILGISAIAAWGLMFVKPEIADHIKALSPFTEANAEESPLVVPPLANLMDVPAKPLAQTEQQQIVQVTEGNNKALAAPRQQQWVTAWLSKRYRVANDATNMLVSAAYLTAQEIKLDPLLILAVMAIESGFNPFAESPVGAQGLMQVMSKIHHDKFQDLGGIKAALNPVANIKVGSLILKDYVTRGGSIEAGLKLYVGAAAFENDAGYGTRVLAEYRRLKEVSAGKKVPVATPAKSPRPNRQSDEPDETESAAVEPAQISTPKTNQLAAS